VTTARGNTQKQFLGHDHKGGILKQSLGHDRLDQSGKLYFDQKYRRIKLGRNAEDRYVRRRKIEGPMSRSWSGVGFWTIINPAPKFKALSAS